MNYEIINLLLTLAVIIPVTIIDIKVQRIPRGIIFPAVILLYFVKVFYFHIPAITLLATLATGFLLFFGIWYFTRGKLGLGDAYLSGFLAISLGLEQWLIMLFISSMTALVFAVIMLKSGKLRRESRIPYAPFLSFGALLSLLIPI
ncbi:prepilin peptidase [Spirochaeta isovalerica]|uniref:Prepilin signal peptidase PulO-like enzyme (Type II secretory pathway) n=1 Tax=Spirochaeta isovalerica TaxID=150 RepID=A0A841R3V5_9SPIO|nr:A24 family peptidase [Spirochaeta isovalerica]MBB6478483.1 prepilin signal peptidase PulO-like enzyme (type II secretory pathway) [Spirochaeta isovalerica]